MRSLVPTSYAKLTRFNSWILKFIFTKLVFNFVGNSLVVTTPFDSLAGKAQRCNFCSKPPITSYTGIILPSHGATLWLDEQWVTRHLPTALWEANYWEAFQQYHSIIHKMGLETQEIYDMVDWPSRQHAGMKLGPSQKSLLSRWWNSTS